MSSVDWSKAPEGATHFAPKREDSDMWCAVFWRLENGVGVEAWQVCNDTGQLHHVRWPTWLPETASRLIARPSAWAVTGLPPVGIDCEYMKRGGAEWFYCTVIAHHDGGAVVAVHEDDLSYSYWNDSSHFRPIRTPEQIAAEEREKTIKDIAELIGSLWASEVECATFLYDAGYRKISD